MASFLIEFYLPRSRWGELGESATRVRRAAAALAVDGARVCDVQSTFLPGDELCLHLVEAESAQLVSEASRLAGIQVGRVVEVVPVAPSDAPGGVT
ncbi:MAG TPA: hypothetical protein VGF25_08545 [Thermoleophilaceae bacterium]|jgi:hypothetical protein